MVYIAGRRNAPVYSATVQQTVDEVKREMFDLLSKRCEAGRRSGWYFLRGRDRGNELAEKRSVRMGIPAETGIDSEDYDVAFGAWYNLAVQSVEEVAGEETAGEETALTSLPTLLTPSNSDSGSDSGGECPTLQTAPSTPSPSPPRRQAELPQLIPLTNTVWGTPVVPLAPEAPVRVTQHNPYPLMSLPMYCASLFEVGMLRYFQRMMTCHSMLSTPIAHRMPSEIVSGPCVT